MVSLDDIDLMRTGYWGFEIKVHFAFLPVLTYDEGWVWLSRYYKLRTAVIHGTGKEDHTWKVQAVVASRSVMRSIKDKYLSNYAGSASFDISDLFYPSKQLGSKKTRKVVNLAEYKRRKRG